MSPRWMIFERISWYSVRAAASHPGAGAAAFAEHRVGVGVAVVEGRRVRRGGHAHLRRARADVDGARLVGREGPLGGVVG